MVTLAKIGYKREPAWTEFFIQCPKMEELIKNIAKNKRITLEDSGDYSPDVMMEIIKFPYYVVNAPPPLPSGKKAWGAFSQGIFWNGVFNMRYFTFEGLKEGVTLRFTQPFPSVILKEIALSGGTQLKEFLAEYGSSFQGTVTLVEKT